MKSRAFLKHDHRYTRAVPSVIGSRRYAAASLHRRDRAATASLTRAVEDLESMAILFHRQVCYETCLIVVVLDDGCLVVSVTWRRTYRPMV